jgi:acyl-CoA synthetase (AMP-forming)/AMP-acid ligase II
MPCLYLGATYVLHRQFDAEALIRTVKRERVTHTMMVPSQIVAMLGSPGFDPGAMQSLQMILSLGAPLHREHKNELNRHFPGRFYELYGLTEGFLTILDREAAARKEGSVGVPPQFSEMRIAREDGSPAAPLEVGEIVGRSPLLMSGYFGRPDLTAEAVRDGWLHTGDLGYLDADGFLFLVDRKKDMIDSGGVKVYPRDIEEVVVRHPQVQEAAVFGVPDERWGEAPLAAVVLKQPGAATAADLEAWINARVGARYQRVRGVKLMEAFPRNAAGKILKRELREPYWTDQPHYITGRQPK